MKYKILYGFLFRPVGSKNAYVWDTYGSDELVAFISLNDAYKSSEKYQGIYDFLIEKLPERAKYKIVINNGTMIKGIYGAI